MRTQTREKSLTERETAGDDVAIEVLDDRIRHLEDRAECEPSMDESLPQRKAELELARRRITDCGAVNGDDSA